MKRARIALIIGALVAIGVAVVLRNGSSGDSGGTSSPKTPTNAVKVVLAYSPEKEQMLEDLERRFNDEDHEVDGRPIVVDAQNWSSGKAMDDIAAGRFQPTVWSPSSSLWGRLLNYQADKPYVARENPSLVRTPLVIAMWEPLARALGWPRKQVTFDQILRLAVSKKGWAAYGKPTYGKFALGHTNPDFSTSGLSFVAAQYYNAAGKREGLTLADVRNPAIRNKVRQIEQSIVHYGDTTLFFADQLKAHGPGYASAVAMEEATLVDFNRTRPQGVGRMVALYPADGTFVSDDPYLILSAPWVSGAQRRAATEFGDYLAEHLTPEIAAKYGFRPGDPAAKPLAPIDKAHGLDPAQPARVLGLPDPEVLARIKSAWHADRKPANVMLVVDTSGSMINDNKLEEAKRGLAAFLQQLSPRDRVGLIYFNGQVETGVPVQPFARDKAALSGTVKDLIPNGDTALYDATEEGVSAIEKLHDDSRINAIVVLSDGQDTASSLKLEGLLNRLQTSRGRESDRVRIFTIAYGSDAVSDVLEKIASAGGGKAYTGDPDEIEAVYLQISSFF
jgi:Ca-activated chloride channel family protein